MTVLKSHGNLRILMTADTIGGVWAYALTLAKALAPHNVELLLATMGNPLTDRQKQQLKSLYNVCWFESHYKLEWMDNCWDDVDRAGQWLMALAKKYQPDIVHLNSYSHGALNWGCPSVVLGHSCVYSWFAGVYNMPAPARWKEYFRRVRAGLKKTDMVTAPTRVFLNDLKRIYGPFRAESAIYNGHENDYCRLSGKEPIIFSAGRLWDQAKNITALDRASKYINYPIFVAGSNRHPCNGSVKHCENLRFLGLLDTDHMQKWYSRAAVYTLVAKYEPFGLTCLEAAASGCALILSSIPSLQELWSGCAVFVDPNDEKQIAAAANELLSNHDMRQYYARKARARAALYSADRMAKQYLRLYRKLLNREPAQARASVTI